MKEGIYMYRRDDVKAIHLLCIDVQEIVFFTERFVNDSNDNNAAQS